VPLLGYRDVPRHPHDVSARALSVLRPLFRYSDWRNAWVLRGVGERFGPVLQLAPGHAAQVGPPRRRRAAKPRAHRLRLSVSLRQLAAPLAVCGIALAIAIGFLSARSAAGGGNATSTLGKPVSAGVLQVSLPDGWRVHPAAQSVPELGLIDGLAASSGDRLIAVGRASTTDPSLLPASILTSVGAAPRAELVTFGGATFYRYLNLPVHGTRDSESVYAVPSGAGTVLAVCRASKPDRAFDSMCQRVVGSLRLRSGSLAPGLLPTYASGLRAVLARLSSARATWGARLSAARTARVQVRAAKELAVAHDQAALALGGLTAGPAGPANGELAAALRMEADAYRLLARAAAHGRVHAYRSAAAAVARADHALRSALAELRARGYAAA
jgi:hypothetical protein